MECIGPYLCSDVWKPVRDMLEKIKVRPLYMKFIATTGDRIDNMLPGEPHRVTVAHVSAVRHHGILVYLPSCNKEAKYKRPHTGDIMSPCLCIDVVSLIY